MFMLGGLTHFQPYPDRLPSANPILSPSFGHHIPIFFYIHICPRAFFPSSTLSQRTLSKSTRWKRLLPLAFSIFLRDEIDSSQLLVFDSRFFPSDSVCPYLNVSGGGNPFSGPIPAPTPQKKTPSQNCPFSCRIDFVLALLARLSDSQFVVNNVDWDSISGALRFLSLLDRWLLEECPPELWPLSFCAKKILRKIRGYFMAHTKRARRRKRQNLLICCVLLLRKLKCNFRLLVIIFGSCAFFLLWMRKNNMI